MTEGIAPEGHRLSEDLPRWVMNDEDLVDLIAFLMSLPQKALTASIATQAIVYPLPEEHPHVYFRYGSRLCSPKERRRLRIIRRRYASHN